MIKTHFSGNHPTDREQALCQIGNSIQPVEFLIVKGAGGGNVRGGTAGKNCPSGKIFSSSFLRGGWDGLISTTPNPSLKRRGNGLSFWGAEVSLS